MIRKHNLVVGKFYVNNEHRIARKVLQTSSQIVTFNTNHLDTGNSCGSPSECTVEAFVRWASSEASPTELAFLQRREQEALLYAADR